MGKGDVLKTKRKRLNAGGGGDKDGKKNFKAKGSTNMWGRVPCVFRSLSKNPRPRWICRLKAGGPGC